ncbi:MAG TPA: Crp/Fnr family transcriptional regulator [Thermoanaerobaculia bacterium]|nr:Crp/Fnr family transcriptional regulator [Thermoanaerobaculia bacterium]
MTEDDLRRVPLFRRLGDEDLARLAKVALLRSWGKGETLFEEGDPSDHFLVVTAGRIKVFKVTPDGRHLILEIFGPGDPVGAVAVYEERPYPATAIALEDAEAAAVPRREFFTLLDAHPTLVRGLLLAMTRRLVELTLRLAELTGGRVESRIARLFLKLAENLGRPADEGGVFIPLPLSRQELADLIGTTIETAIRIMSRWGKEGIVATGPDGFTILDRDTLEELALE